MTGDSDILGSSDEEAIGVMLIALNGIPMDLSEDSYLGSMYGSFGGCIYGKLEGDQSTVIVHVLKPWGGWGV